MMMSKGGYYLKKEKLIEENLTNFLSNKNFLLKQQKKLIFQNESDIKKIERTQKMFY